MGLVIAVCSFEAHITCANLCRLTKSHVYNLETAKAMTGFSEQPSTKDTLTHNVTSF
jgi:hypothetical protein